MTSTAEPETPHDERSAKRGSSARRVLRALLLVVAAIATVWTLVSQFLALVPVVWTLPLLQWAPLQIVVVLIDTYRDVLGVWNVVIAITAVVIFVLLRSPRRRRAWTRITASTMGAIGAVTSTALLFAAVAPAGVRIFDVGNPLESHVTTPNETVTFGTAGDVTMQGDLYLPEGIAPSDGWPVIVSIHGGGFITGTREPSLFTKNLPRDGYAVLDIDWRPATATFHAWDTQVGDVGCALGWLGAEGLKHEVDVSRLAILGVSSGGNLAINSAYMANSGTLTSTCDADATIPDVKAVIGGYPAVNLT
ncbi:alpha/beta hydrolase, partial [Clavibacter michiganensis]|uniref:alpha/beta hydrolase n=1 Tax=Clavibacter michiganensis TaxID=28447 RepID=UPI001365EB26